MLLRIIDKAEEFAPGSLELRLCKDNFSEKYTITDYESPFTDNFRKILTWYFQDYPHDAEGKKDDRGVVEKIIKFGQYLGDSLLGEDHELLRIIEEIEDAGYQNLEVSIESHRPEYFNDLWETLILPESKYVLSSVVKKFTRSYIHDNQVREYAELEFGLKVTPPIADTIAGLNQEGSEPPVVADKSNDRPLTIVHAVYRSALPEATAAVSNAFNTSVELLSSEGAFNYEILPISDWDQLRLRLKNTDHPIHILQLDCAVVCDDQTLYFGDNFGHSKLPGISATELLQLLVESKIPLLCVDMRSYSGGKPARQYLTSIAQIANKVGLGNIIGLSESVDPWLSSQCFKNLYCFIAAGLTLEQAVVETRKALQSIIEISRFTSESLPFHFWSLLVHFSEQTISFFETPQVVTSLEESQIFAKVRQRLLGFSSQLLSPPLGAVTDGQSISLLKQWNDGIRTLSLVGDPGVGKTHTVHQLCLYLAQTSLIDYGFYFDCSSEFYSPDIILEMIAPILDVSPENTAEAKEKLATHSCCFVLDDLLSAFTKDESKDKSKWGELNIFLNELIEGGHTIVATGNCDSRKIKSSPLSLNFAETQVIPLAPVEQKILAADLLRRHKLVGKDKMAMWEELLICLEGNPFLLKSTIPLLESLEIEPLIKAVTEHVVGNSQIPRKNKSVVDTFYHWQWDLLPGTLQKLLLLSAEVDGLLLETLMIACDQKETFEHAVKLLAALGPDSSDVKISESIDQWEKAGFAARMSHGRVIEGRAIGFLASKRQSSEYTELQNDDIKTLFSQVLCEGLKLLSQHVLNQQNPAFSHNLLMNRRHWVKHFERLWFAGDFRGFMGVKTAFEQVLNQAKLCSEISAWSLDLLGRSPTVSVADDTSIEAKLSWLVMATAALNESDAEKNTNIEAGVKNWQIWFDTFCKNPEKSQLPLVHQVVTFLERYHQKQKKINQCSVIAEHAYKIYAQYEAWHWVIQTLKSLANYSVITNNGKAIEYEEKILNDIPYDNSPPGFQAQQMLEIVFARLKREDPDNAQNLLDQLKGREDTQPMVDTLNGLQADIHFQKRNYTAAMPHYCQLWERALKLEQKPHLDQLKQHFSELEENIGAEQFGQLFIKSTEEGTVLPRDYS